MPIKPTAPKKEVVKALSLKNYHLRTMFEILESPLHGQEARARNRIARLFKEKQDVLEAERIKLLDKYAKKNEKGEKILDKSGRNYEMEDIDAFQKEYKETLDDAALFDILPSNKSDFSVVKKIVLEWKKPLGLAETELYEEICQAFEKI